MKELAINIKYDENNKDDQSKILDILTQLSEITEIKIEKKSDPDLYLRDIRYGIALASTQFASDNRSCVYGFHSKEERDIIANKIGNILNRKYEPKIDNIKDELDFSDFLNKIDDIIEESEISYYKCKDDMFGKYINIIDFKTIAI